MESGARFRVALVSDTHGHLDPRIVEVVAGCRLAVHAGDIGSGAVLDTLARPDRRVTAVRGNNDVASKWDPHEHERLDRLRVGGGGLAAGWPPRGGPRPPDRERGTPPRMAARTLSGCPGGGLRAYPSTVHRSQRPPLDRQSRGGGTEPHLRRTVARRPGRRRRPLAPAHRVLRSPAAAGSMSGKSRSSVRAWESPRSDSSFTVRDFRPGSLGSRIA